MTTPTIVTRPALRPTVHLLFLLLALLLAIFSALSFDGDLTWNAGTMIALAFASFVAAHLV